MNQSLRLRVHEDGSHYEQQQARRRLPEGSSRREEAPAAVADHHGVLTCLETVSLPAALVLPFRIAVNLAGAVGAAFFARASLLFYLSTHSLIGGAFLIEQTWFVIAYLGPATGAGLQPESRQLAAGVRRDIHRRPVPARWRPPALGS